MRTRNRGFAGVLIAALLAPIAIVTSTLGTATSASALSGSEFNPGLIITDSLFFDGTALTGAQVQTFLESKGRTCAAGSVCLKSAGQATPTMPARTGLCNAYVGKAWERASDIIARVGEACGISPKVLLVLLQKEQQLVTATAPLQRQYDKATGFACPDTAPCDPQFSGFFYQVYYAAHQFKYYAFKPNSYVHKAGRVNNVRLHPDAACGSTPVYIQNQATAGLYNYTPYQPNAAALNNLYGQGDTCSSYGNRNFWTIYSGWFGSTLIGAGLSAIADAYAGAGGASGSLGAITYTSHCPDTATSCYQDYRNGSIYWTADGGAYAITGAIRLHYSAVGGPTGPIGYPISPAYTYAQNGGGQAQNFQNTASIFASAAGAFVVRDAVRIAYFAEGGSAGSLGWPTSADVCGLAGGGCAQEYQGGAVHVSSTGSGTVSGVTAQTWKALGGAPALGWPISPLYSYSENGGGTAQNFRNSLSIFSSPSGSFVVSGTLRDQYFKKGGSSGSLGWPTGAPQCAPSGTCRQQFQNGGLDSSGGAVWSVSGAIATAFNAAGGAGTLGFPNSPVYTYTYNGGGSAQNFDTGASIFASSAGAFVISNPIRARYFAEEGSAGFLGWPTAAAECTPAFCSQTFQGGSVYSNAAGTKGGAVPSAMDATFRAAGGPAGALGLPSSPVYPYSFHGGGSAQNFEGGSSIFASGAGAFVISHPIRVRYFAEGGSGGYLAWPTAAAQCVAGVCSQAFQGGSVYANAAGTKGGVVPTRIDGAYRAAGGAAGVLGYPISPVYDYTFNGGGSAQNFEGAASVFSSASGAFAISGPLRVEYFRQGGSGGSLGWPTAAAQCSAGVCTQQFQGGALSAPA